MQAVVRKTSIIIVRRVQKVLILQKKKKKFIRPLLVTVEELGQLAIQL